MRSVLHSVSSALALPVLMAVLAGPFAGAAQVYDLAMRYVNSEVITMGDVLQRYQDRRNEYARQARVLPHTREEDIAFFRQSLEELTDDALLVQRAVELGAVPDKDDITMEVLDNARRSGQGLSLRDQADERKRLERRYSIDRVIGYYEGLAPQPTPTDLRVLYATQIANFDRPARARVLQILLRASTPEERAQLSGERKRMLRAAQDLADPALQQVVADHLTRFMAADPAGQDAVLEALVGQLAAAKTAVPADQPILDAARSLAARGAHLRDRNTVQAQIETIRLGLAGRYGPNLITAFRAAAKEFSQGPGAERGGEQGWVEQGVFAPALDAQVFGLNGQAAAPFTLSPVFWSGDVASLILVADSEAARRRSFEEVSGELDRYLRLERRDRIRRQTVAILRKRATIRDIEPIERLAQ